MVVADNTRAARPPRTAELIELMASRRQVEQMPYGTAPQCDAADAWYLRFIAWQERNDTVAELVWKRIHHNDVWYQARHRYLAQIGVL